VIHHGDCVEVMAGMEPESVDAIVTDPPYDLGEPRSGASGYAPRTPEQKARRGFMGKQWDGTGVAFRRETWEAAYRVAKPSAYLLAFGGTRTVHRMTVALEDAGWIIRDMLVWGYASGFPKSKASLKPAWEPIVMARKPGPLRMLAIDECRIGWGADQPTQEEWNRAGSSGKPGANGRIGQLSQGMKDAYAAGKMPVPSGRWPANIVLTDPIFDGGVEGVVGGGEQRTNSVGNAREYDGGWARETGSGLASRTPYNVDLEGTYSRFFELPRGESCDWCGAPGVRPSSSPPSDPVGSVPRPVATSLDGMLASTESAAKFPTVSDTSVIDRSTLPVPPLGTVSPLRRSVSPAVEPTTSSAITMTTGNLWLCEPCAERVISDSTPPQERPYGQGPLPVEREGYTRWLIVPKAARSDREPVLGGLPEPEYDHSGPRGHVLNGDGTPRPRPRPRANQHPTVKPTDLMRHLVRLVTPVGGIVLDPFLGSGTTALAAEMEGFEWVGIEREAEYAAIAEARLNGTQRGMAL
jgi:site-specific DNA-methyltransferase (adenine-specific)